MKSLPFSLIIELSEEPIIEGVAPDAGLMVTVLVKLDPMRDGIVMGKVSVVLV
jgi:hypothetical protein